MSSGIGSHTIGNDSFSISGSKVTGFFSMPEKHVHAKYEIYYLVSGERYYFIKDRFFKIKAGQLVFIKQGELHKTADTDIPDHERILVYFKKEFAATSNGSVDRLMELLEMKTCCVFGLSLKERQVVEKIFEDMRSEVSKQLPGFEACLQALLVKLLVFIARAADGQDEHSYISNRPKHEKVSEIVRYINQHFTEPLTISEISELFYVSPYYLSRIFKETTGFTLVEYINSVRAKEAQILLKDKKLKVIQVAEKAGFGSVAQFNRVFKEYTGNSPLNYRKSLCSGGII